MSNNLVEFAKTSGAKHHDIVGATKYGSAPGRVAGFSESFQQAMSAQLVRLGYEGAMAGNFVRGAAMRLSAPSAKGHAALAASGINFLDYVKPGADPSAEGLDKMLKTRFGRAMSPETLARVKSALDDDDTKTDPASFIASLTEILTDSFAKKNKQGQVNAQDAERIAKAVNEFHLLSTQGVDTERMMKDLVAKGLPPAIARYLFGQEHGGRAQGLNSKQLERDQKNYENIPEDRAEKIADKMQEGAQGEYLKMAGSFETFKVALGEATDGLRSFAYKGIGGFFDVLTRMIEGKQTTSTAPVATWENDKFGILERSRREQEARKRDPEAARARAFEKIDRVEATVKPDQITAKADVSGEATVKVPVTITVNDGAIKDLIRAQVNDQVGKVKLRTNGAGSTGTSSPDAE